MIRNLRQLLKAYWKEQTKAAIKQKKSRLLIYDEHLKRFVSADELLIPNEMGKVNKIGGPITKRKSKDMLYDLLLKKFINTKLDIFSPGGKDDLTICKTNGNIKKHENIHLTYRNLFWGKRNNKKKHRVPALPPIEEKLPLKDQKTTNTGWAGQRTIDPETDPRPELRTARDCPHGPGQLPDKKKLQIKNNTRKKLYDCAKERHKISEKTLAVLIEDKTQSISPKCISISTSKLKNQKVSTVNTEEKTLKEGNRLKSRVCMSGKHDNDLSSGIVNPSLHTSYEMVRVSRAYSDGLPEKTQKIKKENTELLENRQSIVLRENKTRALPTKWECTHSGLIITKNELKSEKTKEHPGKISDQAMKNSVTRQACASSKKLTYLKSNRKDEKSMIICPNLDPKSDQNASIHGLLDSDKKESKIYRREEVPKNMRNRSDSNINIKTYVPSEKLEHCFKMSKKTLTNYDNNCSEDSETNLFSSQEKFISPTQKTTGEDSQICKNVNIDLITPSCFKPPDESSSITANTKPPEPCSKLKDKSNSTAVESKPVKQNCVNQPNASDSILVPTESVKPPCLSKATLRPANLSSSITVLPALPKPPCLSPLVVSNSMSGNCKSPKSYCVPNDLSKSIMIVTEPRKSPCIKQQDLSPSYIKVKNEVLKSNCLNQQNVLNETIIKTQPLKPSCTTQQDLSSSVTVDKIKPPKPPCLGHIDLQNSETFKIDPVIPCNLRDLELSNTDDHQCSKESKPSKTVSLKGLEFGIKPTKPISRCSDENNKSNEKTKTKLNKTKEEFETISSKPSLSINYKLCGIDPQVSEKLQGITQEKYFNELSHENDLTKRKGECYMGFKIIQSSSRLSFINECNNNKSEYNHNEGDKCKKESKLIKKNKNKKSKGSKKFKKGKASLKEECLGKEYNQDVRSKQEQKCNSQIKKSKSSMPLEKHMAVCKKHKLDTITKLSSNMSSRHLKDILRKCNRKIDLKKSISKNNYGSTIQLEPETQERKGRCRLEKDFELKPEKENQLMKTKTPKSMCLTQSTVSVEISNKDCPPSSKCDISLKLRKKDKCIINDKGNMMLKGPLNNAIPLKRSSNKCNISLGKTELNLSSNLQNKQIKQANISDDYKVIKTSTKHTKDSCTATLNLKNQKVINMQVSGLSLKTEVFKTQNSNPKQLPTVHNRSRSETGSVKKRRNYTLNPQSMEKNRPPVYLKNQTTDKIGGIGDAIRNSHKKQRQGTVEKGNTFHGGTAKSPCNTVKIIEPSIASIKAYTDSHDLPQKMVNNLKSNDSKLSSVTQFTKDKKIQKKAKVSQSVILKPLMVEKVIKKNSSLTILDTGNDMATAIKREAMIKMRKGTPGWVEKMIPNNAENSKINSKIIGTNNKRSTSKDNIPSSKGTNQAMKNKNVEVKNINNYNNIPSKKSNSLPVVKYQIKDKRKPNEVQISSRIAQAKLSTGAKHLINVKSTKADRKLVRLSKKNIILHKNTVNGNTPFVSNFITRNISNTDIVPQKTNITERNTALTVKRIEVNPLLKGTITSKPAAQLQKVSYKNGNIKKNNRHLTVNIPNKDAKNTRNVASLEGYKNKSIGLLKSKTYKVSSSRTPKTKIPKTKTFTVVESSMIQKTDNAIKSNTFTVISSRSSMEDKKKVMCTIKKP